jgi:diguanylate cyclase (GGDEF)-like protein
VRATLQSVGFPVELASTGTEAWAALERHDAPEIAILDWRMPGMDGVDLCRKVRARDNRSYTYVLLLSACRDQQEIAQGLSSGADGYIVKPFHASELIERVRAGARILDLEQRLQRAQELLQTEHARRAAELEALSVTDELTGLHNRRGFMALAEQHARLAVRRREPFGIVFIDVNGLKTINDNLGHEVGDRAIREAASVLQRTMRSADIVARLGGDEFVALLDGCAPGTVETVLVRLRKELESLGGDEARTYRLSLSTGVAFFDPDEPRRVDELVAAADQRMYARKRERRTLSGPIVKGLPLAAHARRSRTPDGGLTALASSTDPQILRKSETTVALSGAKLLEQRLRSIWRNSRSEVRGRAQRMVAYATVLARALGRHPEEAALLVRLAAIHEVGDFLLPFIPAGVEHGDSPTGRRNAGAHALPDRGALSAIRFAQCAASVARHYREHWDGSGHPDGLVGAACPFEARFAGVLDAYDHLSQSLRSGVGTSNEDIAEFFQSERARLFDPDLVDALLGVLGELRALTIAAP